MLIIEIILTIVAWQKWGWKSLIPLGAAFLIGFLIGMSGGVVGPGVIAVDILAIIALIVMCFKGPQSQSPTPNV